MKPEDISLENLSKNFEYEKLSRDIDNCNDVDDLKNLCKSYIKLYLKMEETVANLVKL